VGSIPTAGRGAHSAESAAVMKTAESRPNPAKSNAKPGQTGANVPSTPSSSSAAASTSSPSNDEIAQRAYQRWEQSGGTHGDDQRHWYDAERELKGGSSTNGTGRRS
jgi:hypothetical protein